MILYHVTPAANVASIQVSGLIPAHNSKGLTNSITLSSQNWRTKHVWLTHDPEYIVTMHGGSSWCLESDPVILTVDVSGLELVRTANGGTYFNDKDEDVEFLYEGSIDPSRILKYDFDYKKFL